MSKRARERANARPWEAGEQPEPDNWTALARYMHADAMLEARK